MKVDRIIDYDDLCSVGRITHDYFPVAKELYDKVKAMAKEYDITCLCSPPIEFLYSRDMNDPECEILGKAFLYQSERRPETIDVQNQYFTLQEMPEPQRLVTLMKKGLTREQYQEYRERVKSGYYKLENMKNVLQEI